MYLRSKSNRGYYYYCTLHENYNATICPKKAVKQEDVESLCPATYPNSDKSILRCPETDCQLECYAFFADPLSDI